MATATTFDTIVAGTRLLDMDSSWPSGVRSDMDPAQLPQGYAWQAINMLNFGGIWSCRPGYKCWATLPDGNLQGGVIFRPLVGNEIAMAAVDGKIYASVWPFVHFAQIPGLQFSPSALQVFFEQATQSAERLTQDLGSAIKVIPSKNVMMIQDGGETAPGWYDGANAGHLRGNLYETPSGGPMIWVGDRLWVAFDDELVASDISNPFSFRENVYLGGQSSFRFRGMITAMVRTPAIEAPQLMVFTAADGSIVQANIRDRSQWPTTQNFQEQVVQVGCQGHWAIGSHFGKLVWMSPAGVAFFDPATSGKLTTRLPTRDVEMLEDKVRLSDDLSLASLGIFGQFVMMSLPSEDTYNRTTWIINNASFTSMTDDSGPCWNGFWLGTRPVQWMCGQVGGTERAFHVAHDEDGKNRLWETFQTNRLDNGCPITWALFTRGYFGQTAAVSPKPPGSKARLKWVDVAMSAIEEDLDLGVFYAGGMSGSFEPMLVTKLTAERGSLSYDLALDADSQIFSFKPQSRTVRTQDVDEMVGSESGACSVEKEDRDNLDTNFQLLISGQGPATIRWIRPVAIMINEDLSGNPKACEPEEGKRAVRYDGEAVKLDSYPEVVAALANAPENLFLAVSTATIEQGGFIATGAGTAESIISQNAADRVAKIIATKFAEQELGCIQPFIYSEGLGFDPIPEPPAPTPTPEPEPTPEPPTPTPEPEPEPTPEPPEEFDFFTTTPATLPSGAVGLRIFGALGFTDFTCTYSVIIPGIDFSLVTDLATVQFPNLTGVDPTNIQDGYISISSCAALTTISLPVFVPRNGQYLAFDGNALSATTVNEILARCVANPAFVSGTLALQGGTNAAPTGQGVTDKATLIGRGVAVTTN